MGLDMIWTSIRRAGEDFKGKLSDAQVELFKKHNWGDGVYSLEGDEEIQLYVPSEFEEPEVFSELLDHPHMQNTLQKVKFEGKKGIVFREKELCVLGKSIGWDLYRFLNEARNEPVPAEPEGWHYYSAYTLEKTRKNILHFIARDEFNPGTCVDYGRMVDIIDEVLDYIYRFRQADIDEGVIDGVFIFMSY